MPPLKICRVCASLDLSCIWFDCIIIYSCFYNDTSFSPALIAKDEREHNAIQSRETCERKIVHKIRKCRWKLLNWPCPAANFTYSIENNYIWRLSYLNFIFRKCAESVKMGISEEYSFKHLSQNNFDSSFQTKKIRRLLVLDIISYQV